MTEIDPTAQPKAKRKIGRPKLTDRTAIKKTTFGVRLTDDELIELTKRAAAMGMKPGQLLREAALTRRLPSPPVPAINREQYAELARLAANFNQLALAANRMLMVNLDSDLLVSTIAELRLLRLALIGVNPNEKEISDDRQDQ
jgi:hypothetical protein